MCTIDDFMEQEDYGLNDPEPLNADGIIDLSFAIDRLAKAIEVMNQESETHNKAVIARLDLILQILSDGACVPACDDPDPLSPAIAKRIQRIMQDAEHEAVIA